MTGHAWSQDAPADLANILTALFAASDMTGDLTPIIFDGRADQGAAPPFVTIWNLQPQRIGEALAADDWGVHHAQWQVSPHGVTQGQARYMVEQITGWDWPTGWELVEVGPLVNDTTDKPETWFWPITFVYRGV